MANIRDNVINRLINRRIFPMEHWHSGTSIDPIIKGITRLASYELYYLYWFKDKRINPLTSPELGHSIPSAINDLAYRFTLQRGGTSYPFDLTFRTNNKEFDPKKQTIVFFHGQDGWSEGYGKMLNAQTDYNVLVIEYLPYVCEHNKTLISNKIDVNLDLVVDQCYEGIKHLDKVLATEKYYGKDYKRSQDVLFVGHSLGTFITLKVCAKLANNRKEDATVKKDVYAILNYASPIDSAIVLKHRTKVFLKQKWYVPLSIFVSCFIVFYPISLGIFYKVKNDIKLSAKLAVIPPLVLIIIASIITIIIYLVLMHYATKIGITKKDIQGIEGNDLYFVNFESDFFASLKDGEGLLNLVGKDDKGIKVVSIKRRKDTPVLREGYFAHYNLHLECDIQKVIKLCEKNKDNNIKGQYCYSGGPYTTMSDLHINVGDKSVVHGGNIF